jgi:LmbE family N-acetylglucosaminyl deacetylase
LIVAERVLVIAPHPDDESIGCGGAICLHHRRSDTVGVVFLTSGERGIEGVAPEVARTVREAEATEALEVLGVGRRDFLRLPDLGVGDNLGLALERLRPVLEAHAPSVIYLPHPDDSHVDHQAALPLIRSALAECPPGAALPDLRLYEVWSPMPDYDWPEDISLVFRQKLHAIRRYRSQLRRFRYDRAVQGLNRFRGCLAARCSFAEVFRYAAPTAPGRIEDLAAPDIVSGMPGGDR